MQLPESAVIRDVTPAAEPELAAPQRDSEPDLPHIEFVPPVELPPAAVVEPAAWSEPVVPEEPAAADTSLVVITSEDSGVPRVEIQFVPQAELPVAVDAAKPRGRHRRGDEE